jgi:hypothetical protein
LGNRFSQVCPQVAGATWYIKRPSFKNRAFMPTTTIKKQPNAKVFDHALDTRVWVEKRNIHSQVQMQPNQVGDRNYCPMND